MQPPTTPCRFPGIRLCVWTFSETQRLSGTLRAWGKVGMSSVYRCAAEDGRKDPI